MSSSFPHHHHHQHRKDRSQRHQDSGGFLVEPPRKKPRPTRAPSYSHRTNVNTHNYYNNNTSRYLSYHNNQYKNNSEENEGKSIEGMVRQILSPQMEHVYNNNEQSQDNNPTTDTMERGREWEAMLDWEGVEDADTDAVSLGLRILREEASRCPYRYRSPSYSSSSPSSPSYSSDTYTTLAADPPLIPYYMLQEVVLNNSPSSQKNTDRSPFRAGTRSSLPAGQPSPGTDLHQRLSELREEGVIAELMLPIHPPQHTTAYVFLEDHRRAIRHLLSRLFPSTPTASVSSPSLSHHHKWFINAMEGVAQALVQTRRPYIAEQDLRSFIDAAIQDANDITQGRGDGVGDHDWRDILGALQQCGLVRVRNSQSVWFDVPGSGRYAGALTHAVDAAVGVLRRRKFRQMMWKDLRQAVGHTLERTGIPLRYAIRAGRARGLIVEHRLPTTGIRSSEGDENTLLRLGPNDRGTSDGRRGRGKRERWII